MKGMNQFSVILLDWLFNSGKERTEVEEYTQIMKKFYHKKTANASFEYM